MRQNDGPLSLHHHRRRWLAISDMYDIQKHTRLVVQEIFSFNVDSECEGADEKSSTVF